MITYEEALKLGQSKSFDPRAEAQNILRNIDAMIKMNCEKLAKDSNAKISIGITSVSDKALQAQLLPVLNEMVSKAGWQIELDGVLVFCFRNPENKDPKYTSSIPYR